MRRLQTLGRGALMALAALLPFELAEPVFRVGSLAISTVEVALYVALLLGALPWMAGGPWRGWTAVHLGVVLWGGALLASAVLAPHEREMALKFGLRSLGGVALFFIVSSLVTTRRHVASVLAALAVGVVVSALAGVAEVWSQAAYDVLLAFKTQPSRVGGFLRASGTFQYANTAGMYWEAGLPVVLCVGVWMADRRRSTAWRWWAAAAAGLVTAGIVLSASRAGLLGAVLLLGTLIILGWWRGRGFVGPTAVSLGCLVVWVLVGQAGSGLAMLRLRSDSEQRWYRPVYTTTGDLRLEVDSRRQIRVRLKNDGIVEWPASGSNPIALSYHWYDPVAGEVVVLDGARTPLPRDIAPGDEAWIDAEVLAPSEPGVFELQWDLVQEGFMWFSTRGAPIGRVAVQVSSVPGAVAPPRRPRPRVEEAEVGVRPSRLVLWRAGVAMWLERPLLGVGPDNFRHLYGHYLGWPTFDTRIHANNLYVETLATLGLLGAAALLVLAAALVRAFWDGWRRTDETSARPLLIGCAVALGGFMAHGLVDYFFAFTPTYGMFWILTGLMASLSKPETRR